MTSYFAVMLHQVEIKVLLVPAGSAAAAALALHMAAAAAAAHGSSSTHCNEREQQQQQQQLPPKSQEHSGSSSSSSSLHQQPVLELRPSMCWDIPAAFELKTQSVCLAGLDLPQLLPGAAALPNLHHKQMLLPGLAEDMAAARSSYEAAAARNDHQRQGRTAAAADLVAVEAENHTTQGVL
jgi:hypothetical protein